MIESREPIAEAASVPGFTGRGGELDRLRADLGYPKGAPPVVVVYGDGGVGKSALAAQAARRLAGLFPDGQHYVSLEGATAGPRPLDPGEVVASLLRALGVAGQDIPADLTEASARLRAMVAGRRVLLVLDNVTSAAQVRPVLPLGPASAALLTSRQHLATLDGATHLHLDALPPEDAIRLLERLGGGARLAAEPDAAASLARRCDYLPLALRLAGALLRGRPGLAAGDLDRRLAAERGRQDGMAVGDPAVRAAFQVSYQLMRDGDDDADRTAARLFRLLGLHPGAEVGVTTAAALLEAPVAVAQAALDRLVVARFLEAAPEGRYRMHDLMLLLAREQASWDEPTTQRDAAVRRMLHYYVASAQRANRLLQPEALGGADWWVEARTPSLSSRAEAVDWFERERANLLGVASQAAHGPGSRPDVTVRLAEVTFWFFVMRTYWHDMKEITELAMHVAKEHEHHLGQLIALNDLAYAQIGPPDPDPEGRRRGQPLVPAEGTLSSAMPKWAR